MKTITNPERLVSVPFSKTRCGVDFYINTGESKDICGVLTEHRTFKTDFFSFYFFRRANGYVLLNFRKIELRDDMVLLLSPHQQQEWHVDEAELDYTFLIFREDFMRTFIADKFFVYRLLYYYQTDTPPYLFAAPEELAEYMRLLGKIKQELLHPVADLQPYRICALLSVGGYQPGIRQNLPSAGRSAEEQLCLPIQRPVGETYPRHAACSGICRYTPREPYHSEQFCNGAVRRVRHPSAQTTLVGGIEKRAVVLRPQREPVGGRVPLFRPQPSDALLQATDGKDIYAIYHGLPKWNIRMKSKKKLYKTCTPILFFCIFAVGESF